MNTNQKKIIIIIIIIFISIITLILKSVKISFGILNGEKNYEGTKTTNKFEHTTNNYKTTTNSTTTQIMTTSIKNNSTKNTTKKNSTSTTLPNQTTTKIMITETITQPILKEMYYANYTDDSERDFTGRNCLFIYDKDGNITEGYANILYYGKYKIKQFIPKDIKNCFLEDKNSTYIISIEIGDKVYEQ